MPIIKDTSMTGTQDDQRLCQVLQRGGPSLLGELKKGEPHAEYHAAAHEAAMDCQAFCTLTAALMARSSPMAKYAHQACGNACHDCAAACEGHQDEIMKECVKACRDCEKVCRQMAGGTS